MEHGTTPSKVTVLGSPVHPMAVTFPTAFIWATAVSDTCAYVTRDPFWERASRYLLWASVGSGAGAGSSGLADFLFLPKAREHTVGWVHFLGMELSLAVAGFNLFRRVRGKSRRVGLVGLSLSWLTVLLSGLFAFFGGKLAHEHGISVGVSGGHEA